MRGSNKNTENEHWVWMEKVPEKEQLGRMERQRVWCVAEPCLALARWRRQSEKVEGGHLHRHWEPQEGRTRPSSPGGLQQRLWDLPPGHPSLLCHPGCREALPQSDAVEPHFSKKAALPPESSEHLRSPTRGQEDRASPGRCSCGIPTRDSTGPLDKEASVWGPRVSHSFRLRKAAFHTPISFILGIHVLHSSPSPLLLWESADSINKLFIWRHTSLNIRAKKIRTGLAFKGFTIPGETQT